jgi:hypothetical protein
MPRKRKTMSGAAAAPPTAPVDVPYGQAEPMIEAQRRTPVPMTAGAAQPNLAAGAAPATGGDPYAAALQAAQGMEPPGSVLSTPTTRPNEPLTTGLGEQAQMPQVNQGLWELRELARQYGYPDLMRFLQRASLEA